MNSRIGLAGVILVLTAAFAGATPQQPFMRAALGDLQTAKRELQKATPDKGGHRGKAIALVNQAMAEVNAGMRFDRRHNHADSILTVLAAMQDQPHMTAALTALESAKNNLDHATDDKGGHRIRAINLIRQAMDEVKKGIEFAR